MPAKTTPTKLACHKVLLYAIMGGDLIEVLCKKVEGTGFDVNGNIRLKLDNEHRLCHGIIVFWDTNEREP